MRATPRHEKQLAEKSNTGIKIRIGIMEGRGTRKGRAEEGAQRC
jgi:hypothetical protein